MSVLESRLAAVGAQIVIDTEHVAATDFHITAEQRQTMYSNGRQAAQDWLAAQQATATDQGRDG